jgi:hypothetical protein
MRLLKNLGGLFGTGAKRTPARQRNHRSRLTLEPLGERLVPAVSVFMGTGGSQGYLFIEGSHHPEIVRLDRIGQYLVQVSATELTPQGPINSSAIFYEGDIRWVIYRGYTGGDRFTNATPLNCSAWGSYGNDTLIGGNGLNYLYGEQDSDHLYGGENQDWLDGGTQFDKLYGGGGNDRLDGGRDGVMDWLHGGAGQDTIVLHKSYSYNPYLGIWSYCTEPENLIDYSTYDGDTIIYTYPWS